MIVGTEWSLIARCSAAHDLRYQCSGDQLTAISYLQQLSAYKHQLPHVYDSINPTDSHRSYPGSSVPINALYQSYLYDRFVYFYSYFSA